MPILSFSSKSTAADECSLKELLARLQTLYLVGGSQGVNISAQRMLPSETEM